MALAVQEYAFLIMLAWLIIFKRELVLWVMQGRLVCQESVSLLQTDLSILSGVFIEYELKISRCQGHQEINLAIGVLYWSQMIAFSL